MSVRLTTPRAAVAAGAVLLASAGVAAVTNAGGASAADLAGRPNSITVTLAGIGAVPASSYQFGITSTATATTAGKPSYAPFAFTADSGATSIGLAKAAAAGTRIATVTVAIGAGANGRPTQQFSFKGVTVKAFQQSSPDSHAGAGAVVVPPQDQVLLSYEQVTQTVTGANGAAQTWTGNA